MVKSARGLIGIGGKGLEIAIKAWEKVQKQEKYKPKIPVKPIKPKKKVPFEKTKFGKIVKEIQKKHKISEYKAIKRTRALLKIPKRDYRKLNRKDKDVLIQFGY